MNPLLLVLLLLLAGCSRVPTDRLTGAWQSADQKLTVNFVPPNSVLWLEAVNSTVIRYGKHSEEDVMQRHAGVYELQGDQLKIAWIGETDDAGKVKTTDYAVTGNLTLGNHTLTRAEGRTPPELVGTWVRGGAKGEVRILGPSAVQCRTEAGRRRTRFYTLEFAGDRLGSKYEFALDHSVPEEDLYWQVSGAELSFFRQADAAKRERPSSVFRRARQPLTLTSTGEPDLRPYSEK